MSDNQRETFNFVAALEIAKRRYKSSRHWKMLEGTPWENDAPVFAADLMYETFRFHSHTVAEECWTIAHCALRDILSEWGTDPVTNLPDWQQCVDRIHDRARLALEEIRKLEEAHADAFLSGRDSRAALEN